VYKHSAFKSQINSAFNIEIANRTDNHKHRSHNCTIHIVILFELLHSTSFHYIVANSMTICIAQLLLLEPTTKV
jgi:hypothetical protein